MTITNTSVFHEVPEKIKKWREEQQRKIEEKDAKEKEMIEKMREEAAKDLEDWYNQYRDTKEKTKTMNRSAEQDLSSSQTNGVAENTAIWEKISTLCDFGGNKGPKTGRDVTRMRSIFLQLKSSPPAAKNI
jgi:vacuolar-type H+-ATPase subunit H